MLRSYTNLLLKQLVTNKNISKIKFRNPVSSFKPNKPTEISNMKPKESTLQMSVRYFHSTPASFGFIKFGVQTFFKLATQDETISAKTIQDVVIRNTLQEIGFDKQEETAIIKILTGLAPILPNALSQTFSNIKLDRTLLEPKKWLENTIDELKDATNKNNFLIDKNLNDEQRKLVLEGAHYFVKDTAKKSNEDIYRELLNKLGTILVEKKLGLTITKQ